MKKGLFLIIIVIFVLFAASAQATTILSIVDDAGSAGFTPKGSSNELLTPIYGSSDPRAGYYGSTVNLTEAALVTFTFLGFEATFDNDFNLAGPDDDHDDFAVRIQAAPVPKSATMLLVGAGFLGIAFVRRRRRK